MNLLPWFAAGLTLAALIDRAWRRATRPLPSIDNVRQADAGQARP